MSPSSPNTLQDQERLGSLALQFRGTRIDAERHAIANEYAQTVTRLIQSGGWHEMPALEDQLPDAWMPAAFFGYWSLSPKDTAKS
jgi:hypothetical protein